MIYLLGTPAFIEKYARVHGIEEYISLHGIKYEECEKIRGKVIILGITSYIALMIRSFLKTNSWATVIHQPFLVDLYD